MNRIPVGYRVKIRRKWPRVIISFLIFIIIGLSYFLIKPNFNLIKNFFIISDDIVDTVEVPDSNLNIIHEKIKVDTFKESTSNEIEIQILEKSNRLIPINNIDETKKVLKTKVSNQGISEKEEPIILTQSNVFDENDSKELIVKAVEDENIEFDTLSLSSDDPESFTESGIDTSKVVEYFYYVIVGSVRTKEAAEIQQKKFLAMSERTNIIYESVNNRYRISLGTYSGFKEASAKSKKFQSKHPKYKTWIWKTIPVIKN